MNKFFSVQVACPRHVYYMKRKIISDTKNHDKICSTLLVPERYCKYVSSKTLREHFRRLIRRYLVVVEKGMVVNSKKITIRYQNPLQNLKKIPFRPFPEDWAIFKVVASANGTSMTGLFTFLLECELFEQEYDSIMKNCNNKTLQSNKETPTTTQTVVGTPTTVWFQLDCVSLFRRQSREYEKIFRIQRHFG